MPTKAKKDFFSCRSCLEVASDPVVLPCQHGFCLVCVQKLPKKDGKRSCPVCKLSWRSMDLPWVFSSPESEDICSAYKEKVELFCLDHQEVVCMSCRDEKIHAGHKLRPLDEVVKGPTEELMHNVKGKLADYSHVTNDCNEQEALVKLQDESKMKTDFEELRHFLQVEEEASLAAVRDGEEEKSRMKKEEVAVVPDMNRIKEIIKNVQNAMIRIKKLQRGSQLYEVEQAGERKLSVSDE
ncbi:tripartite motif-containing protein 5-like [Festucalex cinctus]